MISVVVPIRLVSELNAHTHWRQRQGRAKAQRMAVEMLLAAPWRRARLDLPLVVTLTRIAPRALDSDNAVGSAKHVRDAVAAVVGVDDRSPLVEWRYAQRKGKPREYGVCIEISPFVEVADVAR